MSTNKIYLSATSIKTYLSCKKRFKYKYLDKIDIGKTISNKYISFGNSMHMALADYNMITDESYKTLDILHDLLRKNWIREGYSSIKEEKEYGQMGLKILIQYYKNPKDIGSENLIIEQMIYKEMDHYILCGKLDKVYLRKDGIVEVLDYKTGKTIYPIDKIQLPVYLILAKEKLGYYPKSVSLYYLYENKKITKELTDDLIEKATEFIYKLCDHICTETNFKASPNSYCNSNCEYYKICEDAKNHNLIVLNSLEEFKSKNKLNTVF